MKPMTSPARSRRLVGVSALACSAVLVTSCVGSVQGFTNRAPDGNPIDAARALPDAPGVVREGSAATSCGEFVLEQGEKLPAEAIAYLTTATEADEAELAWSHPTTEGDPIVYFAYVAGWNVGVGLSMTNEFDSYGGDYGWTVLSCPDATTATNPASISQCDELIEG
ncbi:hypothetical protein PTW37_08695 [Arthrobacter agilis]|uniref:hypothetical protein n=1 Tax=Arthrobacter agilis TaxID=37921 RepID=UPI00236555A3|nr:hypothetical protein [Arthrobacter agilis]WDF31970.1 hypothetical protein PTW37_08695 [Arthrobacter agilis]